MSRCLASQIHRSNTIGLLSLGLHEGESVQNGDSKQRGARWINTTAMEIHHRGLDNVSERSEGVLKHVFVREVDILSICSSQPFELVGEEEIRDTEQLTTHKLSDKMALESSEERYVLCSRNSERRTN